jgi:hypothetical protein
MNYRHGENLRCVSPPIASHLIKDAWKVEKKICSVNKILGKGHKLRKSDCFTSFAKTFFSVPGLEWIPPDYCQKMLASCRDGNDRWVAGESVSREVPDEN